MVAEHQLGKRNLELLQGGVEANAAPRPGRERHKRSPVPLPDLVGPPAVRIEDVRVVPHARVAVQVRQARDDDGAGRDVPAAGQDDVLAGVAGGLEGRAVHALRLLDEAVEEGQRLDLVERPRLAVVRAVVEQLLQQPRLVVARVRDQRVDEPGQLPRAGHEARGHQHERVGQHVLRGELLAVLVRCPHEVVDYAGGVQRGRVDGEVGGAAALGVSHRLLDERVELFADSLELSGVA